MLLFEIGEVIFSKLLIFGNETCILCLCSLKYSRNWFFAFKSSLQLFKIHFHLCRPSSTPLFAFFYHVLPQGKMTFAEHNASIILLAATFSWAMYRFNKKSVPSNSIFRNSSQLLLMGAHTSQLFKKLLRFFCKISKYLFYNQRFYFFFWRNEERPQCLTTLWNIESRHIMLVKTPACPKTLVVGTKQCQSSYLKISEWGERNLSANE